VEIQEQLQQKNEVVREENRMTFRIGVHVGDVMVRGGDLLGDGVNVAARLQTLAHPGGVCVSGEAHQYARKVLQLHFDDLGFQEVRNVQEPIRAYAVGAMGHLGSATAPILPSGKTLPLAKRPSIAVLPFENLSGGPDHEYFADGITEDLITALARVRWPSRRSQFGIWLQAEGTGHSTCRS